MLVALEPQGSRSGRSYRHMAAVSRLTHSKINLRGNSMGVWGMGYGFRRANGVRRLWLALAAFVAAALQFFLRCSSTHVAADL